MARRRLLHGDADVPALDLTGLIAAGELADDLEPDGIGERLKDGDAVDGIEIGC
jgi:hypothetical protein